MNRAERAKQFLPFDTLKGLREELGLREERHTRVEKKELSETQQAEISDTLSSLQKGDLIEVTYYLGGHYITLEAVLDKLDTTAFRLVIADISVPFSEIFSIRRIDAEETPR